MPQIYAPFETCLKAEGDVLGMSKGMFTGDAAVFGNVDKAREIMMPGSLTEDVEAYNASGTMPGMVWYHDRTQPIGEWLSMTPGEASLSVKGMLWVEGNEQGRAPIEKSEQVRNLFMSRSIKGLSVAITMKAGDFDDVVADGVRIRKIHRAHIEEISPALTVINPLAGITSAKAFTVRQIERALKSDLALTEHEARAFTATLGGREGTGDADRDEKLAVAVANELKTEKAELSALNSILEALKNER